MIKIFTIGSNGKSPKEFFKILEDNKIDLVIDVRLNNKSQLAGYAKGGDDFLGFLLNKISGINYVHDPYFAPTDEILDSYHKDHNWPNYVKKFDMLIKSRDFKKYFSKYKDKGNVCLMCVEETPEMCHRRLVAESIFSKDEIKHL